MKIYWALLLVLGMGTMPAWGGALLSTPASVPTLDGWGSILLVGVLGGLLGRWLAARNRRK